MQTGSSWTTGSIIELVNNGKIYGKGGNGGNGGNNNPASNTVGLPGGNAINLNYPIKITNNGEIFAGGGGQVTSPFGSALYWAYQI